MRKELIELHVKLDVNSAGEHSSVHIQPIKVNNPLPRELWFNWDSQITLNYGYLFFCNVFNKDDGSADYIYLSDAMRNHVMRIQEDFDVLQWHFSSDEDEKFVNYLLSL